MASRVSDVPIKKEPKSEGWNSGGVNSNVVPTAIKIKSEPPDDRLRLNCDDFQAKTSADLLAIKLEPANDDNGIQAATLALSNHCIIKQIFLCFDVEKLLELSLVNKVWCSTARFVLRITNKRCTARIEGFDPCWELLMLDNTLAKSNDTIYTGLAIKVCLTRKNKQDHPKHYCIKKQSQEEVTESFSSILTKLPYKYLEIDWDKKSSCPASALIMTILKLKRKELTELKITQLPATIDSLAKCLRLNTQTWLPNLKILDISNPNGLNRPVKFELINAAPKLEKFIGVNSIHDLNYYLSRKKVSLVQEYIFFYDDLRYDVVEDGPYTQLLRDFAGAKPQLKAFTFSGYRHEASRYDAGFRETPAVINRHLRPLLESVLNSLETIDLAMSDLLFVLPEVISLRPMSKLRTLNLRKFEFRDRFNGKTIFQEVIWSRMFPVLKTMVLWITEDSEEVQQVILSGPADPVASSSPTVKEIIVKAEGEPFDFRKFIVESFQGLGDAFPNVQNFTLVGGLEPSKLLPFLWKTWPKLVSISLIEFPLQWENLDYLFCGITEESAQYFYSNKGDSLSVKLEELRPNAKSILSLKELRTFRVEVSHRCPCGWSRPVMTPKDQIFITHVTAKLAFARMPQLLVEIVREVCNSESVRCGFTLDHLKPYVRIVG